MPDVHTIFGGPGTGKTERLINIVKDEVEGGIAPEKIAYVGFTNVAADAARNRASSLLSLRKNELANFRTIHSMAFKELGYTRDGIMGKDDWKELAEILGEKIGGYASLDDPYATRYTGDKMMLINELARATMEAPEDIWNMMGFNISIQRFRRFVSGLNQYKADAGKNDFTDMLEDFVKEGIEVPIEIAIVDEAQDLTPLQWKVVETAFKNAKRVYVAGDDDQAIYRWSGADPAKFINMKGQREVLKISHRLPRKIFEAADIIVNRISQRVAKDHIPTDREGRVNLITSPSYIEASVDLNDGKEWLLLARNRYQLQDLERIAHSQGVTFSSKGRRSVNLSDVNAIKGWEALRKGAEITAAVARDVVEALAQDTRAIEGGRSYTARDLGLDPSVIWHDALKGISLSQREYYLSCLRNGQKLDKPPKVQIETIHGAKGAEADSVILLTDMSRSTMKAYQKQPDNEHRVFYVGMTRAKSSLHIVGPATPNSYNMQLI